MSSYRSIATKTLRIYIGDIYQKGNLKFVKISIKGLGSEKDKQLDKIELMSGDTVTLNWDMVKTYLPEQ